MFSKKSSILIDLRVVCFILLLVIIGLMLVWRPWNGTKSRDITVIGQATIESAPDEFTFFPTFERTGQDTHALKNELNQYGADVQQALIKLGVAKDNITLDSDSYSPYPQAEAAPGTYTVSLRVRIITKDQKVAQKVQDYLAQTDAKGQLTATPNFSTAKSDSLEDKARQKAIKDARQKAEQTAKELGVKVGRVVSVDDDASAPIGILRGDAATSDTKEVSLPITPGKQEVTKEIRVTFSLD